VNNDNFWLVIGLFAAIGIVLGWVITEKRQ
jgi:hypothetical protein